MSTLTEEDKALLTPEEISAIEDPEYNEKEKEALAAIAAQAPDDAGGDDGDEGDDDTPTSAASDAAAATAKPADAPADATQTDPNAQAPVATAPASATPIYQSALPDDYAAKVEVLIDKQSDAWQRFDAGEIDRNALQQELAVIERERQDLNTARIKAEISQEMSAQTAEQQWKETISSFMVQTAKEIDYGKDAAKQNDLDQFVKVLAANPANDDKTMEWFLNEGHKRVMALHGVAAPAPNPKDALDQAKRLRIPNTSTMPTSLAQVPGGEGPGDVSGEFASMDSLEGYELENAIARLTPAQRERYLAA
jgi:hypothetical protein